MSVADSNKRLILIGTLWVNGPVGVILIGGLAVAWFLARLAHPGNGRLQGLDAASIAGFAVPFVLAWLWWSVSVPKWRIWALERTTDWPALKMKAIQAGLIWDETTAAGRLFRRTEIRSAKDQHRIAELEQSAPDRA